jgi:phage terminase small subunit
MLPHETGGASSRPKPKRVNPRYRKKPPADKPLNQQQRRFVEQYLILGQGRAAALAAGYSAHSATELACYLKRLPNVARAIERGRAAQASAAEIDAARVLAEFARIAFSDVGRVAEWGKHGLRLKPWRQISHDDRAAISSLSAGGKSGARIQFHSKQRALESLARHLGLFARGGAQAPAKEDPAAQAANYQARYQATRALAESARAKLRAAIERVAREENGSSPDGDAAGGGDTDDDKGGGA